MKLLEFHADLKRSNELLERIAVALERIAGPVAEEEPYVPRRTQPEEIGRTSGGERAAIGRMRALSKDLGEE